MIPYGRVADGLQIGSDRGVVEVRSRAQKSLVPHPGAPLLGWGMELEVGLCLWGGDGE